MPLNVPIKERVPFLIDVTANDITKAEFYDLSKLRERAWGETVPLNGAGLKSLVWIEGNSKPGSLEWCWMDELSYKEDKGARKQPWHWLKWRRWWMLMACNISNMSPSNFTNNVLDWKRFIKRHGHEIWKHSCYNMLDERLKINMWIELATRLVVRLLGDSSARLKNGEGGRSCDATEFNDRRERPKCTTSRPTDWT